MEPKVTITLPKRRSNQSLTVKRRSLKRRIRHPVTAHTESYGELVPDWRLFIDVDPGYLSAAASRMWSQNLFHHSRVCVVESTSKAAVGNNNERDSSDCHRKVRDY